ncbi:MAG: DUF86 domain-containing protein [Nanoarchaeota archaeon]
MRKSSIDKEKILSKIDELDGYLEELEQIKPADFDEYKNSIEKKRAVERLLQIAIETVIDISNIIVSGLKLGIPYDEDSLLDKLEEKNVISKEIKNIMKEMKGFRNVLVHKYAEVKDEIVFENLNKLDDFDKFKEEILSFLKKHS